MKFLNILLAAALVSFSTQRSIYDTAVHDLEGGQINMSSFQGKKIAILVFNGTSPDGTQLAYLDSLQKAMSSLRVIAVPVLELGANVKNNDLKSLQTELNLEILITQPVKAKKNAGSNQHSLFKWLTDVQENTHFNYDVETDGQLFIVNEKGMLYSILRKQTPKAFTSHVLNQSF